MTWSTPTFTEILGGRVPTQSDAAPDVQPPQASEAQSPVVTDDRPAERPGNEAGHPPSASLILGVATAVAVATAAYFVVTAVIGVRRNWHALPFWDMWQGYLSFWYELQDGNAHVWWDQHNEHRILLAKAFFWVDLTAFEGQGWFLIVAILVSMACVSAVLVTLTFWRLSAARRWPRGAAVFALVSAVCVAMSWSWLQSENLLWGFQIQFLLASLLPLAAFTTMSASSSVGRGDDGRKHRVLFAVALSLLTLSPWTTAAGLFAPFLAIGLALMLRVGVLRTVTVAVIAVGSLLVYRIGYITPPQHSDPVDSILHHPLDMLSYLLTYLGGPVHLATGDAWLGTLAGAFFLAALAYYVGRQILGPRSGPGLAAASFAMYVVVGGVITAAGRLKFGVDQSLASRYQTPLLIAWCCLLILAAPRIEAAIRGRSLATVIAVLAVPLVLIPQQAAALTEDRMTRFNRDVAALAIELGVPDPIGIGAVFPEPTLPVELGRRAIADGLTSLSRPPFAGLAAGIGKPVAPVPLTDCESRIDTNAPVAGSEFNRVIGWLRSDVPLSSTSILTVSDGSVVEGYLVSGGPRPDVQAIIAGAGPNNGVSGYVRTSAPSHLVVGGDLAQCRQRLGT